MRRAGRCPTTSFNLRGEPIVCTPKDAIRTFYSCGRKRPCRGRKRRKDFQRTTMCSMRGPELPPEFDNDPRIALLQTGP